MAAVHRSSFEVHGRCSLPQFIQFIRGAASTAKREREKAIASFDEAIRLDPKLGDLPFYKRYRSAAESLSPNPQSPTFAAEARLGLRAFERADFDQAIDAFDELIRLDPKHSEAHRWRGDASLNEVELDKALSEYDEALRLDPTNAMAYCSRGAALIGKGTYGKGIASLDEAIRLDPELANLSFYNRYTTAAETGLFGRRVIAPLLVFGFCSLAFRLWSVLRRRKREVVMDR
jgi:tetratricopeptide (TPR) repeat protein